MGELGITMERFQIIKRAMALSERGKMSKNNDIPVPYHESTWEATVSDKNYDDTIDNVASYTTQPVGSSTNSVISQKMYEVLKSLPQEENEAVFNHFMTSGVESHNIDKFRNISNKGGNVVVVDDDLKRKSDNAKNCSGDLQRSHYRKGMRRLRRNIKTGKIDLTDVPYLTQTSAYM